MLEINIFRILLLTFGALTFYQDSSAEVRQANPHMHGVNYTQITFLEGKLAVLYQMPIAHFVKAGPSEKHLHGKHEHDNHSQHKHNHTTNNLKSEKSEKSAGQPNTNNNRDAQILEKLRDYSILFEPSKKAKCVLANYQGDIKGVASSDGSESAHRDLILIYSFNCSRPNDLLEINFRTFSRFEDLALIFAEALINNVAVSKKLERNNPMLAW